MSSSSKCRFCKATVKRGKMRAHQSTEICRRKTKIAEVSTDGLVETSNFTIIKALSDGKLPGVMIPCKYLYFVPEWVLTAAKTYNANNKFAGMKLLEFILRMQPTQET